MYGHRYTTEEKEFFRSYIPGHTYKEIQEAFRKRFLPCGEWALKKADESNFRGINYGKDIEEDNK